MQRQRRVHPCTTASIPRTPRGQMQQGPRPSLAVLAVAFHHLLPRIPIWIAREETLPGVSLRYEL